MLYIHIPFCKSKCNYCSFNSYINLLSLKDAYLNALKKTINLKKDIYTLYIGGGTPSILEAEFYYELFKTLKPYLKNTKEITIEVNPDVSFQWLKRIKELGVNRISFGVQSFNDEKLKFLNRSHSSNDAIKAIENAKKAGFENISIDLIYSCKGDNKKLLKNDLDIAKKLQIDHLSAYSLTIEKNSKWQEKFEYRYDNEELEEWFINEINSFLPQYEVSNFGKISIHNLGYWEYRSYNGIGAGAVGFDNKKLIRYYPYKNVKKFISNPTFAKIEKLSKLDSKKEKIFLGFRSIVGVKKDIFTKEEINRLSDLGDLIYQKNDRFYLKNFFLADGVTKYVLNMI